MAIHTVKGEDFHSKLTSCSACRRAGRMAIHAMKVKDFHSKCLSYTVYCSVACKDVLEWEAVERKQRLEREFWYMGKIIKITCVSCGHEWVNEIGCGLLHGSLGNIAELFSEEESREIRQHMAQNAYPVFDFAYRLAHCHHCESLVSTPVLELQDGFGRYIGSCKQCGRKIDIADIIEEMDRTSCPVCDRVSLHSEEMGLWD